MAVTFTPSTGKIDWPADLLPGLDSTSRTWSLWFKVGSVPSTNQVMVTTGQNIGTLGVAEIIRVRNASGALSVAYVYQTSLGSYIFSCNSTFATKVWHHFLVTFNRATLACRMFVDGIETTGIISLPLGSPTTLVDCLRMGQSMGSINAYAGDLAEVCFWKSEFNDNQILSMFHGANPMQVGLGNLMFYAPLIGYDVSEPDYISRVLGTKTSISEAKVGPPILLAPRRSDLILEPEGVRSKYMHYQKMRRAG